MNTHNLETNVNNLCYWLAISIVLGLLTEKDNRNPDPVTSKGLPERNTAPNSAIISPPDLSDS
jgi:hypothetical protein